MKESGLKRWIVLVLAVLVVLGAYVAAGPYLTVRAIRGAVEAQDAAALARQVDFPALRASLKTQLSDRLVRKAGPELQSNPFAAVGLTIAESLVGGGVDAMVTPIGLSALMEGHKTWRRFEDGVATPAPAADPLHDAHYAYHSPSRFTATVLDDEGDPIVFVMTRDGLRWTLSDIRLPP